MSKPLRCAIYTRKSSDEGLDQAFNSLDAQREAGEAYIKSQASEGWRTIATCYDDGGFSGGSMERPALKRLLQDVDGGLVDVVVVYKIDRLTRSLADFARIVERFDARSVSFVSVTQAFNTTSSMGRLTLNVLLSFAQFEREVTGERIRDKIAASKARGMWMGGVPPLGYDLPAPGSRTLQVNDSEAASVRTIFARYLEIGSVHRLQDEMARQGIVSKRRVTAAGKVAGGQSFGRGALFHLLQNRIYLGQITHKGDVHQGEHQPVIEPAMFDEVQQVLASSRRERSDRKRVSGALLTGRIYDAAGEAMSPTFSYGRSGRVYRYYVSSSLQQGSRRKQIDVVRRVSAPAIETLVVRTLERLLSNAEAPVTRLKRLQLNSAGTEIELHKRTRITRERLHPGENVRTEAGGSIVLSLPVQLPLRGGKRSVVAGVRSEAAPDAVLIGALRKAHAMLERDAGQPILRAAPPSPYERRLLRLAFLAPELQAELLTGRQPHHVNLEFLMQRDIPLAWSEQRDALNWGIERTPVMAMSVPDPEH